MKRFTNDIVDIKRGNTDIQKVYRGENLVWERVGPTELIIGDGVGFNTSTQYPTPYGNFYFGNRLQIIYRPSELISAGFDAGDEILEIAFDVVNVNNSNGRGGIDNFSISMKHTSANDLTSTFEEDLLLVYGPLPERYVVIEGWNYHILDETFIWDGVSSIIINICNQDNDFTFGGNASVRETDRGGVSSITNRQDGFNVCSNTNAVFTQVFAPNTKFVVKKN